MSKLNLYVHGLIFVTSISCWQVRTVIVTADIHAGLDQELSPPAFTFAHWSRVTPYTWSYDLAESYVFAKQSVVPLHCGPGEPGHPFYRRYGVNLPSSLRRFHSRALEYSSRIPVSVCGTGTLKFLPKLFLEAWRRDLPRSRSLGSTSRFSLRARRICLPGSLRACTFIQ